MLSSAKRKGRSGSRRTFHFRARARGGQTRARLRFLAGTGTVLRPPRRFATTRERRGRFEDPAGPSVPHDESGVLGRSERCRSFAELAPHRISSVTGRAESTCDAAQAAGRRCYETGSIVVNGAAAVLHAAWCRAILAALLTDGPLEAPLHRWHSSLSAKTSLPKHTPRRNCI